MDSRHLIKRIVCECFRSSESPLTDVQYKFVRAGIKSEDILTRHQLSLLETKSEEEQTDVLFLDYAPTLGIDGFKKLVNVIREVYPHVSKMLVDKLNSEDTSQNQSESTPSMSSVHGAENSSVRSNVMGQSVVMDSSNNSCRMGLPDLSECRLNGTECEDDVQMLLGLRDTEEMSVKHVSGFETRKPNAQNQREKDIYSMDCSPKGILLIISNQKFKNFKEREGTEVDRDNLALMFHALGWQVTTKRNLRAKEMAEYLRILANNERLKTAPAVAVAILTHGLGGDVLFGTDGKMCESQPVPGTYINRFQLMQKFTRTNCPQMVDKPKWFILQACRGTEEDIAPDVCANASHPSKVKSDSPADPVSICSKTEPKTETVGQSPEMADMCCLFSSSPGYKAYRRKKGGSPFIVALKKCVEEMAHREEINKIFKEVRVKMAKETLPNNIMTLPESSTTLLKDWFLDPPQWTLRELP